MIMKAFTDDVRFSFDPPTRSLRRDDKVLREGRRGPAGRRRLAPCSAGGGRPAGELRRTAPSPRNLRRGPNVSVFDRSYVPPSAGSNQMVATYTVVISVLYLVTGVFIFLLGLTILRTGTSSTPTRATALILFFTGLGPVLTASSIILQSTLRQDAVLYRSMVENFEYLWEFYFPSLLLFSLSYPRENRMIRAFAFSRRSPLRSLRRAPDHDHHGRGDAEELLRRREAAFPSGGTFRSASAPSRSRARGTSSRSRWARWSSSTNSSFSS